MVVDPKKLRPFDFEHEGVRLCLAKDRRPEVRPCDVVVLCPALFCREHWGRLPHYLQEGIVRAMVRLAPHEQKAKELKELVTDAVAFLLGPA
jgi:hypothetical protein